MTSWGLVLSWHLVDKKMHSLIFTDTTYFYFIRKPIEQQIQKSNGRSSGQGAQVPLSTQIRYRSIVCPTSSMKMYSVFIVVCYVRYYRGQSLFLLIKHLMNNSWTHNVLGPCLYPNPGSATEMSCHMIVSELLKQKTQQIYRQIMTIAT